MRTARAGSGSVPLSIPAAWHITGVAEEATALDPPPRRAARGDGLLDADRASRRGGDRQPLEGRLEAAPTRRGPSSRAGAWACSARSGRPAPWGRDRGPDPGRDRPGRAPEDRPEGSAAAAPSSSSRLLLVPHLNASLTPAFFPR